MSNVKIKKLQEIAERFMKFGKEKPAPVSKPENYEAAKIKGSETTLEYDPTLTVGSDVMQSSGTGSTPAVDGAVELDNGIKFTVKDGKIESVENDGNTNVDDETKTAAEKMAALELRFTALEAKFNETSTSLQTALAFIATLPTAEVIVQFNTDVQAIGQALVELADIPVETALSKAGDPDAKEAVKTNFEAVATMFMVAE